MEVLFWLTFGGAVYAYFGYPLVLVIWGAARPRPIQRDAHGLLAVSIVLPVHNEESQIEARLEALANLDYPPDAIEILVVSDGSTDGTNAIARNYAGRDPRVRLIEFEHRRGKGSAMNAAIESASNEIIVFMDAGIALEPGSLRALIAPFADPTVGCVSGEDRIPEMGGEALYGRYELFLRQCESRIHSIVGASGSFFAQRRELCPSFGEGLAPDLVSVLHVVEMGRRAVTEPDACGSMKALASPRGEFRRKVRTVLRGMSAVSRYKHLLNPARHGAFSFFLISHKLLRWAVPALLVVMLATNVALAQHPFYAALMIPHGIFYALGAASLTGFPVLDRFLPVRVAGYFVNVNAAIVVAWWRFAQGERSEVWAPTRR
jgi:glycosyltransferase involved in cell wall biosynthesis